MSDIVSAANACVSVV